MNRFIPPAALAACLVLAACGNGNLSQTFGLTRSPPNEFMVTTQPPLSMPPDFSLTPPEPGAPRPQVQSGSLQAEEAIAPQVAIQGTAGPNTPGQAALVSEAGPPAPANIRQSVDRLAALDNPGPGFVDELMFWKGPPQPGTVVNPAGEQRRLRQNAALGQSPTVGQTPIVQKPNRGLLGNLF